MLPSLVHLGLNVLEDEESADVLDVEAFPTPSLVSPTSQHAITRVVNRGSVVFSLMVAGGRVADLLVDLNGVPSVATYGRLRSLIGDSWIMTSSALMPYTGKLDVPTAMIRAAVMLIAKRIWKIQQFAPVREALVLMHFAALAGKLLTSKNQPLSDVLTEISAVPIFIYTAIAEVIRNAGLRIRESLCLQLLQEVHSLLPIPQGVRIGELERGWRQSIPLQTRSLHHSRRPTNPRDTLLEWGDLGILTDHTTTL